MFSRILVPLDLSDRNEIAVEAAVELARASGGSILLLHVIEEIEDGSADEFASFYAGLRRRAESTLGEWRARLERKEITVEERIRMGRRGPEVVRCAEEERCDLVVLRSHVLDRGEDMRGIGTVSHQVALAASCPVLLVR
ncbi:MAG: universal stress protein [Deltaproteobacteria bacterium]|jgi:nucleotide-binding universal stress UspA family protein|nr:universal stress protein [Deltaproteobacteria bacterium]MBW2498234.1 universal stress protein [Deltaproteobacteria bacterium]